MIAVHRRPVAWHAKRTDEGALCVTPTRSAKGAEAALSHAGVSAATSAAAGRGARYWRPSARACASASEETKFQAAVINLPVQLQS